MTNVFIGSQAVREGAVHRWDLGRRYRAIFPDIYVPRSAQVTLFDRTVGAWLWSRERGVITGLAAAALWGSTWVDADTPIELMWQNNRAPAGIVTRNDRFGDDDVIERHGMAVAVPEVAAFDIGRYQPRVRAVAHLDALARAAGMEPELVLAVADARKGARGVRRLRRAVAVMDAGAQSPRESRLRLMLVDDGYPTPVTQIPVFGADGRAFAFLDMGWPDRMLALEYEGDHHRTDRVQFARDIARYEMLQQLGWTIVRVTTEHSPAYVRARVRRAWAATEPEHPRALRSA